MTTMNRGLRSALSLLACMAGACSQANDDEGGAGDAPGDQPTPMMDGASMQPAAGMDASDGDTQQPTGAADTPGDGAAGASAPSDDTKPAAESVEAAEALDPDVDWTALTLVYPKMYSAYDGVHIFQVPAYVDGVTIELSDWSAIPASAVQFDPDPELGGVLITVLEDTPEITIAAKSGQIGGVATLYVTSSTPEQWQVGESRYANGVDYEFPPWTIADLATLLLDPNWEPPMPPPNLACNICHTTGAKYFEIQHTPTQAARFSDDDLREILSMGKKPDGIGFRILPPMIGSKSDMQIYSEFHTWESTEEERTGLIVYLRSLTPQGQGDVLLPDGTYVPAGAAPPGSM